MHHAYDPADGGVVVSGQGDAWAMPLIGAGEAINITANNDTIN